MKMTTNEQLQKYEQQMRDNAYAIANINEKMKDIDRDAARKALVGIIDYLNEKYNEA